MILMFVCFLFQNVFVLCSSLDNKSLVFHAMKYFGGFLVRGWLIVYLSLP